MPASFREKVLLKTSIYHIVAFVNNKCMGREIMKIMRWFEKTVHLVNICKIAKIQIRRCNHPILRARNIGGYLASICNLVRVHVCFVYLKVFSVVKTGDI